jgi:hypothetical protein
LKKAVSAAILTLFLGAALTLVFAVRPIGASGTIYVRADGSIDPVSASVTSADNVTCTHSTQEVIVVPEFPSSLILRYS